MPPGTFNQSSINRGHRVKSRAKGGPCTPKHTHRPEVVT